MKPRTVRTAAIGCGVLAAALFVATALSSWHWVGTSFPGFFVMANRVVPSIALPDWSAGGPSRLFQHEVVAVDDVPVADAAAVYERVRQQPAGTVLRYTARGRDGATKTVVVPSRQFTAVDFVLLFGAYLVNGLAFVAVGLLVLLLKPESAASWGLFSLCMTTGVFVITAADLYGPATFFRLHVIAESLMGAGALHLALVFPTDRLRGHRAPILAMVYAPFVALATAYEMLLWSPPAYTLLHLVATAAQGVGSAALIVVVAYEYLASRLALVRRRVGLVAAGAVAGFLVPAALMATSTVLGGSVPLNAAAFTAFLFPVSIGYAIVQQDLFEIDVVLRRTLTYALAVTAIAALYLTVLVALGAVVPGLSLDPGARFLFALLNLAVLLAIAPLREGLQSVVDRVFFRRGYDAEEMVASLSHALSVARTLPEVASATLSVLRANLWPRRASILLRRSDGTFASASSADLAFDAVALPAALAERCQRGEIVARYEWEDGSGQPVPEVWSRLGAELIVPLRHEDAAMALLVLDAKESGRPYNTLDVAMLRTAASQIGLALATAEAFGKLERLNASLEGQVRTRTAELEGANVELNASLAELRRAYAQLEQSQASLMRADRLATLGRLAAGIAHEMNTPLGAVMNALESIDGLGKEYRDSIDDPQVLPADHREIAGEIVAATKDAATWARKAASFIRRMKLHVREIGSDTVESFPIAIVVDEVQTLLSHRLRASRCAIELVERPPGVSVVGDPSRLGQVLVNLVVNALDAYEERDRQDCRILIRATAAGDEVTLEVEDEAGGIPAEHLPRIFDELFTTKEPGRGTGLGLWIARNLVEQNFAGTLVVRSAPGAGSCFTATLGSGAAAPASATARTEGPSAARAARLRQGSPETRDSLP